MGRPRKYKTDEESLEAKTLAKRRRRNDASSQQQELSRQLDTARRQLARASESADRIQERRQEDASRHQLFRALESPEHALDRQQQDATRHQVYRAYESADQLLERHQQDAARHQLFRALESPEQLLERQQHDASRHQLFRAIEPVEQILERKKEDAARHLLFRASQTRQQRAQLNAANASHAQMRRKQDELLLRNSLQRLARTIQDDESQVAEHYCGKMSEICESCGSKNFIAEKPTDGKFTQCCQKGKVILPQHEYTKLFQDLMTGEEKRYSSNFMKNIRNINSSFAFASMGAKFSAPPGRGPYCFRIHGQIYHRTGTLHPGEDEDRKFSQLYILDPVEATSARMHAAVNDSCNPDLMREIALFMEEHNGFAKAYKMLHLVEREAEADALVRGTDMPNIVMAIKQNRNQDPRRYNNPTACEVAVVFENNDGEPPFNRDI